MLSDRFGYSLTTASEEAAEHYRHAVDRMLTANFGAADALDAALHADPDFALARVAKARWLQLYMRIPEAQAEAAAARGLTKPAHAARSAPYRNHRPGSQRRGAAGPGAPRRTFG